MKKLFVTLAGFALLSAVFLLSCKKDEDDRGTAQVNIHLTDGPGNYDAVYIDVRSVEINSDAGGWVTVPAIVPGVYNLLDFRNGMDTLLCQAVLPAGKISQMRLILGDNNSVVVDGTSYPLSTPSAQQSGLKFNIHQDLAVNGSYNIWIDFDAGKSIVAQGNGGYSLKPVVRAYTELTDGRIKGIVLPPAALATVYVTNGADTFSAIPDALGAFMFCGLPEGNYTLWFDAEDNTGYADFTLPAPVTVSFGVVTEVGTTTLLP